MSDSKEHILNVAFKLFLQKSFKEVTMKEIVEKTGLSKGAFYHYFESKEKLFLDVLNHFLYEAMNTDYSKFSQDSLYQFYNDCLAYLDSYIRFFTAEDKENVDRGLVMNFFTLIFDSLKIFPEFRHKINEFQEKETAVWKEVIRKARKSGEIQSPMSDEQISQFFISTSDGVAMRLFMKNSRPEDFKRELSALWENFYIEIKV